jgi:subtilisin family serine protease
VAPTRFATPIAAALAGILLALLTAVPGGPIAVDSAFAAAPDGRLVVTWRSDAPATLAVDGVAEVRRSASNSRRSVVVARDGATASVAARLKADPRVESVVPDAIGTVVEWPVESGTPDDPLWSSYQADMRRIGMPAAWPVTTGDASVVVAVLDTGYEGAHEDLAVIPTVSPYNSRTGSTNVTDGYGHGTHVAGTIAAATNNATGVAGIAPGVTIMPVKVMDSNGQGYWSDFLEGVDWARTHGASVVNLSLGGTLSASQAAAWQPVFTAAWNAGVLVIAAAGNNNTGGLFYPASFAYVISVSATTNSDAKASFSNYGPSIDLSAPGVSITSTYKDGTYRQMSGTSMATPHVVGLAALVRSLHPEFTPAEVETAMKATALDLGAAGRDDIFGYGRIRAPEALAWAPPDITPPVGTLASPLAGAKSVAESIRPVVAFDEPVTGVDATSIMLTNSAGQAVAATVAFDALTNRATLTPASRLASRSTYRVVLGGAIADAYGNLLVPTSFGFTTGDTINPTVIKTYPARGATGVARGATIHITFSEKVTGVSKATLKLKNMKTGARVVVTVRYDSATRTATMDPSVRLRSLRWYRVKILSGIEDVAGRNLAAQSFTFKTRA